VGLSKVVNFLRDHAGALSLFSCLFSSHLVLFCFCFVAGLKDDDLYRELWKLCAGPLVDVPRTGDRVFYFPQGHMEQVCIWFFFSLFLFFFFVAVFGVVVVFLSLLYLHTKTLRPSGLFFFFFFFCFCTVASIYGSGIEPGNSPFQSPGQDFLPCCEHSVVGTVVFVPLCCCFFLVPFLFG